MSNTTTTSAARKPDAQEGPYPWYALRLWHGMLLGDWARLLVRHGKSISPSQYGLAFTASLMTPWNSLLRMASETFLRRRIESAEILPPLFVLGHWRSGTTMLHELLTLDEQFTFANTYQCMAPHHFVLTTRRIAPLAQLLAPAHRPMDSMPLHVNLPQEDEFALCILGAPSPYLSWGFPGQIADWPKLLDTEEFSREERARWQEIMRWFARRVSTMHPKRIVFKSPPHTARIRTLLEVFPQAQFLHIIRDPYDVFLSTVRMWRAVTESQQLEKTNFERLEEQVFEAFSRMYRAFERDRPTVPEGQFHEIRFEELVARPLEIMEQVYQQLNLGDFAAARPKLEQYFADRKEYKKREYRRDPELERRVMDRWGEFITRFGYARATTPSTP